MSKAPVVSVVILSFNTKELLRRCLESVLASKGFDQGELEVLVVDNNSSDGSPEMVKKKFTQVNLIKNKKNLGFSAGNNIGISQARGEYILLLNSDTEVDPDTLGQMQRFVSADSKIGVASCRLELEDGKIDPACHRGLPTVWNAFCYLVGLERLFPGSRLFGGYHRGWADLTRSHEVDVVSGAFMMVPRKVIDEVGLLDERFFLYGEDIDWCFRIKQAGYQVLFNPGTRTIHYKKQSGRAKQPEAGDGEPGREARYHFIKTMEQFYRKHYLDQYPRVVSWLVVSSLRIASRLTFNNRR